MFRAARTETMFYDNGQPKFMDYKRFKHNGLHCIHFRRYRTRSYIVRSNGRVREKTKDRFSSRTIELRLDFMSCRIIIYVEQLLCPRPLRICF